jgi:2-iminobutanoate/2-iminopropanoate deaminase
MASQHIEYIIPAESKAFCDSIGYAEGVKVGNMLYLAGQVGWNPATGKVIAGGLREQVRGAFKNMKNVIEHAGGRIDGVVQLMSFLADNGSDRPLIDDFSIVVEVQREFFATGRPCGTVARVKQLAFPELLVELQAIVAL